MITAPPRPFKNGSLQVCNARTYMVIGYFGEKHVWVMREAQIPTAEVKVWNEKEHKFLV